MASKSTPSKQEVREFGELRPKYIAEKNRMFRLKLEAKERHAIKVRSMKLFEACGIPSEQMVTSVDCDNHYKALDRYLHAKIQFWSDVIDGKMRVGMKEKLQETLTEWLEMSWAYLGQEEIKEDSENAIEEFDFMKTICEHYTPKKQKNKVIHRPPVQLKKSKK